MLGHDVVREPLAVRRRIGLAGQFAAVDGELTGRENVEMIGRLYRLSGAEARRRAGEMLERFRLLDAADRRVATYSGGMRRRLDLAAGLIGRPPVVLLDEPTAGLDPRSRAELWSIVEELRVDGTTVLLTTQYLEEADRLAQQIAVVDHGRIVAQGTPASTTSSSPSPAVLSPRIRPTEHSPRRLHDHRSPRHIRPPPSHPRPDHRRQPRDGPTSAAQGPAQTDVRRLPVRAAGDLGAAVPLPCSAARSIPAA